MLIKQCQFSGADEDGVYFHLLHPGYKNTHLTKTASVKRAVIREVDHVMSKVPRNDNTLYALISAMGSWEYWGQNTNGDAFPEKSLIHTPRGWDELSMSHKAQIGKTWEWGYPTFYNAHAFQHHVNKDPARAFGNVVYAMWDPFMKRVLLVIGFDRNRADAMGAIGVIDKIENGEFPDVSMGCKVPYDLCTRCTDWDRITGNPKADLDSHRKDTITGLSETTKDYCDHLTHELGRVYSDGVKAGMINLHPRFFDLSVVFIGADKTSKVMAKLAGKCPLNHNVAACGKCKDCDISSSHVYEVWSGGREKVAGMEKTAAKEDAMLKEAFGLEWSSPEEDRQMNKYFSKWKRKQAEIEKKVKSNFEPMLPRMDDKEDDLPEDVINDISCNPGRGLRTAGSLGIVLKPREFQRTMLISMGKRPLADKLDSQGTCFRCGSKPDGIVSMGGDPMPDLIQKLIPLIAGRSAFGPAFHKRIIITVSGNGKAGMGGDRPPMPEEDHPLMRKLSAGYSDYRRQLMYKVASDATRAIHDFPQVLPEFFPQALDLSFSSGLAKTGGDVMESLIGMMPTMYLNGAYLDEPVSGYVDSRPDLESIVAAGVLATRGRVA